MVQQVTLRYAEPGLSIMVMDGDTPAELFSNPAMNMVANNPLVADQSGRLPEAYVAGGAALTFVQV